MSGHVTVVGIGPGHPLDRTHRAERAIRESDVVVGYGPYLKAIHDLLEGKPTFQTGMRSEVERCREALRMAREGHRVALVSSGDAGIYGMAGLTLELAAAEGFRCPIHVIPGVSAAQAAAAALGAPLMLDWACLSLSDLLVPWEQIRLRLEAVAAADLVVALYNPRSHRREAPLREARSILLRHRPGETPVGLARDLGGPDERVLLSTLADFPESDVDMRTLVIVGNRSSRVSAGWFLTPRGYRL